MLTLMATKQTTKKSTQSKSKLKPEVDDGSSVINAYEGVGKQSLSFFGIGFALVFFALFLIIAFVSYLFTGDADYSLLDSNKDYDAHDIKNVCGSIGAETAFFFLNNCFGLASFIIPPFLILVGFRLMDVFKITLVKKFIFCSLFMIWLSVCLAFIGTYIPYLDISFLKLGGMHGIKVIKAMSGYVGVPGIMCTLMFTAVLFLIYISSKTIEVIRGFFRFSFLKKLQEKRRLKAEAARVAAELAEKAKAAEEAAKAEAANADEEEDVADDSADVDEEEGASLDESNEEDEGTEELGNEEEPVSVDDNDVVVEEESSEVAITPDDEELAIANALSALNAAGMQGSDDSSEDDSEGVTLTFEGDDLISETSTEDTSRVGEEVNDDDSLSLDVTVAQTELGSGEIIRGVDLDTPYDPHLDLETYKYPTTDLLAKMDNSSAPSIDMAEQQANKDRIIHVMKTFGVDIASIKATIGPTITLYEIVPAEGTRISKIRNLEDDIALSLAAEGIRIIAPIPGKGTIGIEVPNKKKCIVSMESIINSRIYQESTMDLPCAVGKTISNEVFMFDLAKAPHLLVAGATGQGKSVGLNAIVTSLLYKKHPSELKIVMVDPKKVEFSIYSPIENHFLARLEEEEDCIITDVQKVVKTLNSLCVLMDSRYDLLKKAGVRNIKEYNAKFKERKLNPENGHEFMPYIVVIVDEFGDLIMTAGKEVELPICRIAQLARAVGIHMIIATQRPQASIISGAIKTNFPTRIAFKVSSMMDSRVILDRSGANQLIGKGDMLFLNGAEPVRVQCAFVDTPEVSDICHHIARQQSYLHPLYLPDVPTEGGDDMMGGSGSVDSKHLDPLFAEVAKFVVSSQQGSTSMIQRNYSIGYNRAGKIMDQLEKMGVVGAQVGSKPRQVLIQDMVTLDSLLINLDLH